MVVLTRLSTGVPVIVELLEILTAGFESVDVDVDDALGLFESGICVLTCAITLLLSLDPGGGNR